MSSFFRTLNICADEASAHPDAIRRMRRGEFDALLIRDVFDAEACKAVTDRLEDGRHGLVRTDFPPAMRAYFLGMNLNLAEPDLTAYFEAAPRFKTALAEVFHSVGDLQERLTGLFSALDEGRRYRAAPGPGADHMFTTLRAHLPRGYIPPHFDNEQAFRPSYGHITPRIKGDLFSFVLAFSQAETEGALEIFDLSHDGRPWRMDDRGLNASRIDLDGVQSVQFRLAPGEAILFNSGRRLHRLAPVGGAATRWTACSFMAEATSDDAVYCWG